MSRARRHLLVALGTLAAILVVGGAQAARAVESPPGAPTLTNRSVADHSMTVSWTPPATSAGSPVTGYRVARDGTDAEGKGPWSTVIAATQRSFTMTLLTNGVTYSFSVAAISSAGQGAAAIAKLTPTASTPSAPVSGKPGAPVLTASSAGDQRMTATWAPPTQQGSSAITGYRVARDGTDAEGKGPWSTVLSATQRTFTMTLLTNDVPYVFSISAVNGSGTGVATTVRLTPRRAGTPNPSSSPTASASASPTASASASPTASASLTASPSASASASPSASPTAGVRPIVVQSAANQPASLRMGGPSGQRLRMAGVCVWGVPDQITDGGGFGLNQYNNRAQIVAAAKSWGANHIRLRVLADDYNNDRQGLSKAQRLAMIKGWRDTTTAAGLYFYVTWWDSLDGYAEDANWPSRYQSAFAMMTDVYKSLGNDDRVFYEPFNEPNSFGDQWNAWSSAMRATVAHWRSLGYTGILIIDTPGWSHAYDDTAMTALEQYDAARPGMTGNHQLVFARHDYANEGWPNGGNTFDATKWRNDTGGAQQEHLIWETEYGNYNGDPSSVHLSWSQQASTFFADELNNPARPNYVGATPFTWGPWWDANALTDGSNSTPTAWGLAVRDNLLRRAAPTRF